MLGCRFVALALMAVAAAPAGAAPTPPPAAAQPDPLRAGFEALPEPDRRALQAALIWTADFAGTVAGGYGPRTRDALLAYARCSGVAPAAALDAPTRARLLADADAARRALGFAPLRDPRTGIAIGIPSKLAPLRSTTPDGTRYVSPDGAFAIELTAGPGAGPEGLAEAFARLGAEAPGRRVTYRLQRPDFVVVTGETGDRAFYARSALDPAAAGGRGAVRGFIVTRPKGDRNGAVALAVAASFDPFPAPEAAAPVPASAALVGEAVLVGPGLALTRIDRGRCAEAEIEGAPAQWIRQDPASGLALLRVAGHADAAPIPLSAGRDGAVLALFLVPGEGAPALSAAGVTRASGGRVRAPLQGAEAGTVLLDGAGALAGLTGPRDGRAVSIAGVVAETRYDVAGAEPVGAFLKDAAVGTGTGGGALEPGEAAARWRSLILPLRCRAG